ncbi:MAG: TatD family hydrolase [bacterium]
MILLDTHCHLTDKVYTQTDIEYIFRKLREDNIFCISMATDLSELDRLCELSDNNNVYFGFGIHPYDAYKYYPISKYQDEILNKFNKYKINNKLIFIGEVGIDLYRQEQKETKKEQLEVFEYFVYLACEYDFPLSIHSRAAEKEVIDILSKYESKKHIKAVFHCYTSEDKNILNKILENNWYIGIGGIITFSNKKNNYLREIVANINLNNVLIETDSPYLSPEPYRNQTNYPFYVKIVYQFISNLRKIDLIEFSEIIFNNIKKIAKIK